MAGLTGGGIDVEMHALEKGKKQFKTMDRFCLPWPEPRA
jgi:hypothetical protein